MFWCRQALRSTRTAPSLSRTATTPQPPTVAETKSPGRDSWPPAHSGRLSVEKTVRFSAWKASPWQ
jgi:hypothetical protein